MTGESISIHLDERHGIAREQEAIRVGVPLARAWLPDALRAVITDANGQVVPHQVNALAQWPDRSVKWLLVDALVRANPGRRTTLYVSRASETVVTPAESDAAIDVRVTREGVEVDTGRLRATFGSGCRTYLSSVIVDGIEQLRGPGADLTLVDVKAVAHSAAIEKVEVEERGPLRTSVLTEGSFPARRSTGRLRFRARAVLVAGSAAITIEIVLHNPRAAQHRGGLWDLGDAGSLFFEDLTLMFPPALQVDHLRWRAAESSAEEKTHRRAGNSHWTLYQDSSGGGHWQSPNHIGCDGRLTVRFRGYRVSDETGVVECGDRATPVLLAAGRGGWIGVAVRDFWQNFPKAIRWRNDRIEIGLFPGEAREAFELQGGEQKRHTVVVEFGTRGTPSTLAQWLRPLLVSIDPTWVERSGAVDWMSARADDDDSGYADYVGQIVEGPHAFVKKREIIDEYGWRHFGELYADHEAVHSDGAEPFISHYNNQYDFVYGAFVHFMRSGDFRWRQLMEDAARHHIDIDIYHTHEDKAAFNGGLFWHTDHYKPAATCTHRTYSRQNATGSDYGGGPSNEHNYTSGLLHYFYLTGDREAATSVCELANWVFGMDDGSRTLFALIDSGPTGGASRTVDSTYHCPGRGAGNSINALLDAYSLTRAHRYLAKAEELIQRCIHPHDDIAMLALDDPEHRWSYLVFLQTLGKYLAGKLDRGEVDYLYHYARDSLLHYADWVARNEVPYKEVLNKVELPTETWPAHDIRKCHVAHLAADLETGEVREWFRERAGYFFGRCLADVKSFPTAHFTRPLVILCVYGWVHEYFRRRYGNSAGSSVHNYDFGAPSVFVPQHARVRSILASNSRTAAREAMRLLRQKLYTFGAKLGLRL